MKNDFRAILQQIKDAAEGTFNTADMATEALARAGYAENLADDLYVLAHQTVVDMAGKVLKGSNGRNDAQGELFKLDECYPLGGNSWAKLESLDKKTLYAIAAKHFSLSEAHREHGRALMRYADDKFPGDYEPMMP